MVKKVTKEESIIKLKQLNYIIIDEDEYLQNEKATTNYRTYIKCLNHDFIWESTIGEASKILQNM